MPCGYTYILCTRKNGTLYVGSTSDLHARLIEHRSRANSKSFTAKYDCHRLVWYEAFETLGDARARENAIKRYKRQWKIELIEANNPDWREILLDWDD